MLRTTVAIFVVLFVLVSAKYVKQPNSKRLTVSIARPARMTSTEASNSLSSDTLFIVRTCAGQQDVGQVFHLGVLLDSLQNQTDPNWTALLVNTDLVAMKPLAKRHAGDPRIRMANVTVTSKYDEWNAAYPTTDAVIQGIGSAPYRWFVVTNGDNVYAHEFLEAAKANNDDADVVTVDFYGRFKQHGSSLEPINFAADACLESKLERGYIDLGGALLSWPRYRSEKRRFMDYGAVNAQDGLTFADMAASGWRAKRVAKCLFSHSPNPYACAQLGGVWFRSAASRQELGDACWSKARLKAELARRPGIKQSISSSGLPYAMLPDKDHERAIKRFEIDQTSFHQEYMSNIGTIRAGYCKQLRAMGYILDAAGYAANNEDLKHLSNDALRDHFWTHGCVEARSLARYPRGYFRPQLPSIHAVIPSSADTLVVYIFSDTDPEYAENLAYFLRHGIAPNDGADYVIVVQRTDDDLSSPPPVHVKKALDNAPAGVTILHKRNSCYDWGSFGWALQHPTIVERDGRYKYWVLLNASVRGPFVPAVVGKHTPWHRLLTSRLGGSDRARIVGPIISCEGSPLGGDPKAEWRSFPHVQSWLLAMDTVAMGVLRTRSRALTCAKDRWEAIWNGEIGASEAVLASGHNLAALHPRYEGVDWSDPAASKCNQRVNPTGHDFFDGLTLMPSDMLFVKYKAGLLAARHPAAMAAKKLSAWADARLLEGVADVAYNDFVEDLATHKVPRVAAFLARGATCFDAQAYRAEYKDLASLSDDELFAQAAYNGQFEHRVMKWRCAAAKIPQALVDDQVRLHASGHSAPADRRQRPRTIGHSL